MTVEKKNVKGTFKNIKQQTWKLFIAKKIRIVIEGIRVEDAIASRYCKYGINNSFTTNGAKIFGKPRKSA